MKYVWVICVLMCFSTYRERLYCQAGFWEQTSGPTKGIIQKLVVNANDYLFAVVKDSGIYRSTDNGTSWTMVNTGITNLDIRTLITVQNGDLYAGGDGVFRSTDAGLHWTAAKSGLPYFVHKLVTNSNGHLFAATGQEITTGGIYRSTNNGGSWTNISLKDTFILNIAINYQDYLFAKPAYITGVLRSTNNGMNWVTINSGLNTNGVLEIICRPNGDIYCITSSAKIYRSTDNGDLWSQIDALDIKFDTVESLAFNLNGHIFAGLSVAGVKRSTDNGSHWTTAGGSLSESIPSLAVNSTGTLFAGTYGHGVYRSKQTTVNVKQMENGFPATFELKQNYPNPFNPSTTIGYKLPKSSFVKLVVYNALGQEVKTLLNEEKSSGNYSVEFDASHLSSGVYFYCLQTNGFMQTKKLNFIR